MSVTIVRAPWLGAARAPWAVHTLRRARVNLESVPDRGARFCLDDVGGAAHPARGDARPLKRRDARAKDVIAPHAIDRGAQLLCREPSR